MRSAKAAASKRSEDGPIAKYVYILQSESEPSRFYTGVAADLKDRVKRHNAGEVPQTSKYAPWRLKTYIAFSDESRAFEFERYLKTASGRAFAKTEIVEWRSTLL